jgi:hypothetical protein
MRRRKTGERALERDHAGLDRCFVHIGSWEAWTKARGRARFFKSGLLIERDRACVEA